MAEALLTSPESAPAGVVVHRGLQAHRLQETHQRRQWFGERLCQERGEAAFNRLGLCAQVVQLLGKQVVILFQFSDVSGTCSHTLQGVLHVFKPGDGVVKLGP